MGKDACEIMASAIDAVDPYHCVRENMRLFDDRLIIDQQSIPLSQFQRVFLVGFGKASVPMAKAIIDTLEDHLTSANVITKDPSFLDYQGYKNLLKVYLGGHPIPNQNSVNSTQAILDDLPNMTPQDLILIVISGGGSALFTAPMPGISLDDMGQLTNVLLKSGADIYEINTLRKHLDQVKGGRLARKFQPATIHSFILSDVVGDRLDMIASGPTAADPTTYQDAMNVISEYKLRDKISSSIIAVLERGLSGKYSETLKIDELSTNSVSNHIVAANINAASAAKRKAVSLGYHSAIISTRLTGLTEHVAEFLDGIIQTMSESNEPVEIPACLIFGGETTVQLTGEGLGGRNQDLVLRMIPRIAEREGVLFISLATDGEDGPTDAAGAASDALILRDGAVMGLDLNTAIDNNNSYRYLNEAGALIKTGSTGTNVNDLIFILSNHKARER
jgi:hydroxypyruvate reductase